jgi:hypothetical protein
MPVVSLTKPDEEEQIKRRITALLIARRVLERRSLGMTTIEPWTSSDLLGVASWVLGELELVKPNDAQ